METVKIYIYIFCRCSTTVSTFVARTLVHLLLCAEQRTSLLFPSAARRRWLRMMLLLDRTIQRIVAVCFFLRNFNTTTNRAIAGTTRPKMRWRSKTIVPSKI